MNETSLRALASRQLPAECLSDLTLDRLRCVDLAPAVADAAEQHLKACERCRERAQLLASASADLARALPDLNTLLQTAPSQDAETPAAKVASLSEARSRRSRRWAPVLAVLSAAAALALFLGRVPQPEGEIRLKGGVSGELEVFVRRDKKVFRWQAESLHPGDQLRYSFRAPEPLHVMVFSREANGAVNQYFPEEPHSFAVNMGATLSKSATELDATLGVETLWGVFCQKPFTAEGLLQQLESSGTIAPAEGCATQRLEFTKVTP